jgi:hypothetical protein
MKLTHISDSRSNVTGHPIFSFAGLLVDLIVRMQAVGCILSRFVLSLGRGGRLI